MTKSSLGLLIVLFYVFVHSFFYEPNTLSVTSYDVKNEQLAGYRIAFLSDFHLKKYDYKKLDKIVKLTNAQKPDIVLLGGDIGASKNLDDIMDIGIFAGKINLIDAPVYAVLGEYDWHAGGEEIAQELRRNGIRVLENSSYRIYLYGKYIDIVGIGDYSLQYSDVASSFYRTREPRIVFTHNPDVYYDIIDDAAVILAGHTHGGQFILPFTPPLIVDSKFGAEFASGVVKLKSSGNRMIISRGLGTTGIPLRMNCKPEIVIVNFK